MKLFYELSLSLSLAFFISISYAEQTVVMKGISSGVEYKCNALWVVYEDVMYNKNLSMLNENIKFLSNMDYVQVSTKNNSSIYSFAYFNKTETDSDLLGTKKGEKSAVYTLKADVTNFMYIYESGDILTFNEINGENVGMSKSNCPELRLEIN